MSGEEKIVMPAPEEIDRAVEHIVEEGLGKGTVAGKKRRQMRLLMLGGAAVIALVLAVGIPLFRKTAAKVNYPGVETVQAVRPVSLVKLSSEEDLHSYNKHNAWWNALAKLTDPAYALQEGMRPYYERLMKVMLTGQEDNAVCSPLNIYMALAMLAEVTDGNTRQQILDMLGAADIESLRAQVQALWDSNYVNTPILQSLLANSLWLGIGI